MFLPIEFLVVGAAIAKNKKQVTSKEVAEYQKKCDIPLEWGEDELHYCSYNDKTDTYILNDNLQLHPQIIQILLGIAR